MGSFFPKIGVRGVLLGTLKRSYLNLRLHWPQIFGKKIIVNPMDHKVEVLGIILSYI